MWVIKTHQWALISNRSPCSLLKSVPLMHLYSSAPLDSEGNHLRHCIFLSFTAKHTSYFQDEDCNNQNNQTVCGYVCHLMIFNALLPEQFVLTCSFRFMSGVERTRQKQSIVTTTQRTNQSDETQASSSPHNMFYVAEGNHIRIILAPLLLQHIW